MRTVLPVFFALASAAASTALMVACSSTSDDVPGDAPDATSDVRDDVRRDGTSPEGGARDGGKCSVVKGACDIVLQDCPDDAKGQKQECVVTAPDDKPTTACVPVQSSQTLPIGRSCCPGAGNPCLPGLTCVGDPCVDGGPVTGRCSPACCEGDDQACSRSDPEGIAGACDITLFIGEDTELHRVCSYRERCKPFGQEPCKAGQLCIIEDKLGTSGCINSFNKQVGEPCKFSNDCADGLMCFGGGGDGGAGSCRWMCLTPNAIHPFDAGVEQGGPGKGGCPAKETCNIGPFQERPGWLSLCTLDGG